MAASRLKRHGPPIEKEPASSCSLPSTGRMLPVMATKPHRNGGTLDDLPTGLTASSIAVDV
jgi:hypothetical protein